LRLLDRADQLVQLGDRLVEGQRLDILGDAGDRAVQLACRRASVPSAVASAANSRHRRWTKRHAPSMPFSLHSRSRSGG
jgi:hypothetical protein